MNKRTSHSLLQFGGIEMGSRATKREQRRVKQRGAREQDEIRSCMLEGTCKILLRMFIFEMIAIV